MNFQNLELTEKVKNQPKKQRAWNGTLFEKKSKNLKKKNWIFLENFWFFNEFPEFRINEKYRKPASPKNGKFARFSRKLVHVFQGKNNAGFKKEMKLDL